MNSDETFRKASAKFSRSYMSNTKWRKFFAILRELHLDFPHALWKFIDSPKVFDTWGLSGRQLGDYDGWTADGATPPVEYRFIEWIKVVSEPKNLQPDPQVTRLCEELLEQGKFETELAIDSFAIYGYRP